MLKPSRLARPSRRVRRPSLRFRKPEAPKLDTPKPEVEEKEKKRDEYWTVTAAGITRKTPRSRCSKARDKVLAFLERQKPPVRFEPSLEYLQSGNFVRDESFALEVKNDPDGHEVSANHWCTLKVDMSPALYTDILKHEHQVIQGERQWLAGKILAVLVGIVLAIGGYFYLDEATKGYYTLLLRLGALTVVGAVGLVVWLVVH